MTTQKRAETLLQKGDPKPYRIENHGAPTPCIIICDHAGNKRPKALGDLGLSKADLKKHISWDPGTEHIGRYLSQKLKAPMIYSTYSRLVVDLNRHPRSADFIRKVYDHVKIPANKKISDTQKKQRLKEIYKPYHKAVREMIDDYLERGVTPLLLFIHSFTPEMDGVKRPWEVGFLWNDNEKLAHKAISFLKKEQPHLVIGKNEPYSLKKVSKGSVSLHAEKLGLPYLVLEYRQDLVSTKKNAEKWAEILRTTVKHILENTKKTHRSRKL